MAEKRAYLECVGLPGSGKTTLVEAVRSLDEAPTIGTRDEFRERTVVRPTKADKAKRQARLIARFPSLASLVDPVARLSWANAATLEETMAFLLELATAREALDEGPPTLFFDEGACQRIFSIALTQPRRLPQETLDRLFTAITKVLDEGFHLVHLRITPQEAARRIQDRSDGWKRWDPDTSPPTELLEDHQDVFRQIRGRCRAHGIPVIELDAQAPIEKNREAILDHLPT